MKFRKVIFITKEEASQINKHLKVEPTCEEECLSDAIAITNTVVFSNGIEMDIKCCGVQYNAEFQSNLAWTEAVLFDNGSEVCCTEPSDEYIGEWNITYNGDEYEVVIEVGESYLLRYYNQGKLRKIYVCANTIEKAWEIASELYGEDNFVVMTSMSKGDRL